jgi:hypothetical protein
VAKERTIEHAFYDDTEIASLSIAERYLFQGMVARCADDEGRLHAEPAYLRKEIFGYDDDVSKSDVATMLEHIVGQCRNVVYYEVNGQAYIWLVNFAKKQKIRWVVPSKLPPPPQNEAPSYSIPQTSADFGTIPKTTARVGEGRVEKSRVGVGSGAEVSGSAASPPPPPDEAALQETETPDPAVQLEAAAEKLLSIVPRPAELDQGLWPWFVRETVEQAMRSGRDPAPMLAAMLPDVVQDIRRWNDGDPKTRGTLKNWLRKRPGFYLRDNPLTKNGASANGHATSVTASAGPGRQVPTPEEAARLGQQLNGRIAEIASRTGRPRSREPGAA